ncbi:MAG: polyamine aminopropyltransferase [Deltaproteobacteria bacterium]|jgi:spermidine synthase|nr:polyamine aminopropyltransferase [Deltaproteobacteria bacterium]MBT6431891.1 polyamine aminopropyltransferase [Deltaproteobacteria bacterium]MBT6492601.1 polyamine aminopropyltransferase [Deltaproteobacteria bacterium]
MSNNVAPPMAEVSSPALLLTVFVAAVCGLVYELIAGTLSSYLLGDSVTQFSLVIGMFLTSMGIGAYLSKFIEELLLERLILIEMAVGCIGGLAAGLGFAAFAYTEAYGMVLTSLVITIGILVGMEIPLVIRILRNTVGLEITLAHVMSLDYVGALLASLVFPFVILPQLGLVRGSFLMGFLNIGIALYLIRSVKGPLTGRRKLTSLAFGLLFLMSVGFLGSSQATLHFEDQLYQDDIIFARNTGSQRMIVTRWRDDIRLYLNGHLQFSSVDEYRYHETLVHPAMAAAPNRSRVLILGGGDGMAAREVLRYPDVTQLDLVDLDPEVTAAFRDNPMFSELNNGSLSDPRIRIYNEDAMKFMGQTSELYDVILMDLPDPSDANLGKLYSRPFFELVGRHLTPTGRLAAQCTSPFRSRAAFWSIVTTLEAARFGSPEQPRQLIARPYHTVVPSFGTWGFVVASMQPIDVSELEVHPSARYLTSELLPSLFTFPNDMKRIPTPVSSLDNPVVVNLYRDGYNQYFD